MSDDGDECSMCDRTGNTVATHAYGRLCLLCLDDLCGEDDEESDEEADG